MRLEEWGTYSSIISLETTPPTYRQETEHDSRPDSRLLVRPGKEKNLRTFEPSMEEQAKFLRAVNVDYRMISDDITNVIASGLHYIEHLNASKPPETFTEATEAISGGIERYKNDAIYHAKVQLLVARLLEVIRKNV